MALVQLSVVEQRLDAVRAVLAGASGDRGRGLVRGVSVSRFMAGWLGIWSRVFLGLTDRSHRPRVVSRSRPVGAVEVRVAEMRRQHPRWGAKRIRMELLQQAARGLVVIPSTPDDQPDPGPAGPGDPAEAETAAGVVSYGGNGRGRCSCGSSTSSAGCGWSTRSPGCCGRRRW